MAAGAVNGKYFPLFPYHDSLPDPEIRTFITNFYKTSDTVGADDLWASFFLEDAVVTVGSHAARGEKEIRALRQKMWSTVTARTHILEKVFPGRFGVDPSAGGEAKDCEYMLYGKAGYTGKDGTETTSSWSGHAVVRKVREDDGTEAWKFVSYRVWLQPL